MRGWIHRAPVPIFAAIFCLAPWPNAPARESTAADLIQRGLSRKETLKTASKGDLLSAVCQSVRKQKTSAAAITSTAVSARGEYAADIVAAVLRCAGKINCEFVGTIVAAAVAGKNDAATSIADAAMAREPNCAETIEHSSRPAPRESELAAGRTKGNGALSAAANPSSDEDFDPLERLDLVCDQGAPRAVRQSLVEEFLRAHPGSFRGPCPPTPVPKISPLPGVPRLPTPATSPAPQQAPK